MLLDRIRLAAALPFLLAVTVLTSSPARAEAPVDGVWDLTSLFESPEAWQSERDRLEGDVAALAELEGTLAESPAALAEALDRISGTNKDLARFYVYASLAADADTRVAEAQEREQSALVLYTRFEETVSFVEPEILAMADETVREFADADPRLQKHRFYLEEVLRQRPHVLGAEAESVLAASGVVTSGPNSIYNLLANANLPFPTVTLSTGEEVLLNQSGYGLHRQAPARADRKLVFDSFWQTWADFEDSLGAILGAHVRGAVFRAEARDYDSVLAMELAADNLPTEVYDTLIAETRTGLPTLHRYFALRARMLGVEEMRYYDIYPPLVTLDKSYPLAETIELALASAEPLGAEYIADYRAGIEQDWMHVYPQEGKRSGAYMNGWAYDVHPFILLNHNDDYNSLSTFVHEWGHAMHSVYANRAQPWETAGYATFIAEIAAMTKEELLNHYLVERANSDEERLFYLGQELEALRGGFFRQAMFSEFEQRIHEIAEAGEPLSGERLTSIYGELLKAYHGHDEGVVIIDDLYTHEWAFIPHFYYGFYVFQYSTSLAAATYFAEEILNKGEPARERFLDVLRAGGSDHPYEILKKAGLDMATPVPYRALVDRMNTIMDEMDAILDARE